MSNSVFLTDGPISVSGFVRSPWWAFAPRSYLLSAFLNGLATALVFKWIESLSTALRRSNRSTELDAERVVSGVLPELLPNLYEAIKVIRLRPITGIGNSPVAWNRLAFSRLAKAFLVLAITLFFEGGVNILSQPSLNALSASKVGCVVLDRDPQRPSSSDIKTIRGSFSRQISVNLPTSIAQLTSLPTFSFERTNLTEFLPPAPATNDILFVGCTTNGQDENRIRCRVQMERQLFQFKIRVDLSTVDGRDRFFINSNQTKLGQPYSRDIENQLNDFTANFRVGTPVYAYKDNGFTMNVASRPLIYNYMDEWAGDSWMTKFLGTLKIRVVEQNSCNYIKRVPGERTPYVDELVGTVGQRQYSIVPVLPLVMFLCLAQIVAALVQWALRSSYHEPTVICALERLNALGDTSLLQANGEFSVQLRGFIAQELRLAHVGYSRPTHFPENLTEEVSLKDMHARLKEYEMDLRFR
jgi:hypothetical protein